MGPDSHVGNKQGDIMVTHSQGIMHVVSSVCWVEELSLLSWAANHLCKAYDSGGLQRWVTDFRLPVPSPSTWPSGSSPACRMVSSTARAELQENSASAPWFVSAVNTQNVPSCALQCNSSHPSNKPSLFVKLSHVLSVI